MNHSLNNQLSKANAFEKQGRFQDAIKTYRKILILLPLHAKTNGLLGNLLLKTGQFENALEPLERAIQGEPHNLDHRTNLIAALHRCGKLEKAKALIDELYQTGMDVNQIAAISESLNQPPLIRQKALVDLFESSDLQSAEIAARLFVQDYPDHPLGWQIIEAILQNRRGEN